MKEKKHIFVVCAYKESPYLGECLKSLKNQTVPSDILVVTSTPNLYIENMCTKFDVPILINEGESGIAQDWNFGYKNGKAEYVTIAHQDDIYSKKYVEEVLKYISSDGDSLIIFTDYGELRNGIKIKNTTLLKIKKLMLLPLKIPGINSFKFVKRMIISFGNPICCPSVTYHKSNLPEQIFHVHFRSNVDWETWEVISKIKGKFIYIPQILVYHRIHEESETSAIIGDNQRSKEDFEMFSKFWPKSIARLLTKIYANSEKSNQL